MKNPLKEFRDLLTNSKPTTRGTLLKFQAGKAVITTNNGVKTVDINTDEIEPGRVIDIDDGLITKKQKNEGKLTVFEL